MRAHFYCYKCERRFYIPRWFLTRWWLRFETWFLGGRRRLERHYDRRGNQTHYVAGRS